MSRFPLVALLALALAFPAFAAVHPARKVHHAATSHRHVVRHTSHRRIAHRTVHHHLTYAERVRAHREYEAHLRYEEHLRVERRVHEERLAALHLRREHEYRAHEELVSREHHGVVRHHVVHEVAAEQKPVHPVAQATEQAEEQVAESDLPASAAGQPVPVAHVVKASLDTQEAADSEYIPADLPLHVRLYYRSPLIGTRASLLRQNERDEAEGLHRIQDEAQLEELVADHKLIHLPLGMGLQADVHLAADRQYVRPWTAHFLRDLARAHEERFHDPLIVTSAVRPERYQAHLLMINGNAAPATGVIASPHEFGATIDIGKKGMRMSEIAWMRGYLLLLQEAGKIDVEEEFHQACFHITVYDNYDHRVQRHHLPSAELLAAHVP